MRLSVKLTSAAWIAAAPAFAQTAPAPQAPQSNVTVRATSRAPMQATTTIKRQPPTLFPNSRLPVRLDAPVPPPYDNSSLRTVGGQPATGQDAIAEQGGLQH